MNDLTLKNPLAAFPGVTMIDGMITKRFDFAGNFADFEFPIAEPVYADWTFKATYRCPVALMNDFQDFLNDMMDWRVVREFEFEVRRSADVIVRVTGYAGRECLIRSEKDVNGVRKISE